MLAAVVDEDAAIGAVELVGNSAAISNPNAFITRRDLDGKTPGLPINYCSLCLNG